MLAAASLFGHGMNQITELGAELEKHVAPVDHLNFDRYKKDAITDLLSACRGTADEVGDYHGCQRASEVLMNAASHRIAEAEIRIREHKSTINTLARQRDEARCCLEDERLITEGQKNSIESLAAQLTEAGKKVVKLEAQCAELEAERTELCGCLAKAISIGEELAGIGLARGDEIRGLEAERGERAELDKHFGIACSDRDSLLEQRRELKSHVADQSMKISRLETQLATQAETIRDLTRRNAEAEKLRKTLSLIIACEG